MTAEGPPPVRPTQQLLPLLAITPEQFQSFCRDLVKELPGIVECHQYGVQGDPQRGIDLVATTNTGETIAHQCRRVQRFSPGDLRDIVANATFEASHYYVLLACRATAGVCDEAKKHPRWTVWDVDQISAKVRALSQETARRIVRTTIGAQWCRDFLGLQPFTAFLAPDDFFRPLVDPLKIFNHSCALVGRTNELAALEVFLAAPDKLVFVLSGRGGIGKSKVLQVFAERAATSHAIYFVLPDVAITLDSLNELPRSMTALIIEDAHRRDDLGVLLTYAARTRTKLVLATRPQLREAIPSLAASRAVDLSEIVSPEPMEPLGQQDTEAIAADVLGPGLRHLASALATATKDCPLITVVGGRLLRDQRVPPALLANDTQFREAALAKFFDEIVEHAAPGSDDSNVRRVLEVVAALAPVNPHSQRFASAVKAVSTLDTEPATELCMQLERHGVLARRDDGLRIVPDLLSDYVLGVACERPAANGETFVHKIVGAVQIFDPALLRNLAAVDWRVGKKTGQELRVLGDVWDSVVSAFKAASHSDRRQMLRNLKEVGVFLPKQMLDLARFTLAFPSSTSDVAGPFGRAVHTSHEDVIAELPEVVRYTAFSPSTFDEACDLLWQLANDDRLRAHQPTLGGKSPVAILQSIMGYRYGHRERPWVHEKLMKRLQLWLKVARTDAEWLGILSIAQVLFGKTLMDDIAADPPRIALISFTIDPDLAREPREAAIEIAALALEHPSRIVVGAGVKALAKEVEPPHQIGGLVISDELIARWRGERLGALGHLETLAKRNTDPVIGVLLQRTIEWYAEDHVGGQEDDVRAAAKRVLAALPNRLLDRVADAVANPWGNRRQLRDDEAEQWRRRIDETAREFVESVAPPDAIPLLNDHIDGLNRLELRPVPDYLAAAVARVDTSYTVQLCHELLAAGEIHLASYANSIFWSLRSTDPDRFHELIREAVANGKLTAAKSLVSTYGSWIGDESFTAEDLASLQQLHAMHMEVAVAGLSALPRLAKQHPRLASELVLAIDLAADQQRAAAMAAGLLRSNGELLDALSDDELERCVQKLAPVPQLEDPDITEMLKVCATRVPLAILEMFADRIEIEERAEDFRYTAIPIHVPDIVLAGEITASERYIAFLRRIDRDYQSGLGYRAPRLFALFAGNISKSAVAFLRECSARRTDSALMFVANCLRGSACRTLILDDPAFAQQILADAAAVGHEVLEIVRSALFSCTVPRAPTDQMRSEIHTKAEVARDTLPIGERARDFYQEVVSKIQRIDLAAQAYNETDPEDDE